MSSISVNNKSIDGKCWIPEPGKKLYTMILSILFCLLCFVTFYKIGCVPIQNYDESRHGVSAYEMLQTGDPIVTTYNYETDYINLKPPLSEYIIALGYRIFGYNTLGFHFFSGVSWIVIAIGYTIYAHRRMGKKSAIWVLFTFSAMRKLYEHHGPRTGDADAIFLLFFAYGLLFLICYNEGNVKYLYGSCLCFSLCFLSKSLHAGVLAVPIVAYVFLYDRKIFKNWKRILICLTCALGPIAVWAVFRYQRDGTRFFELMYLEDFLDRSTNTFELADGGPLYYVIKLLRDFSADGMILLISLDMIRKRKSWWQDRRRVICFLSAVIEVFLFSIVKSKFEWYIWSVYPALILLSGFAIRDILINKEWLKIKVPVFILSLCLVLSNHYRIIKTEIDTVPDVLENEMLNNVKIQEDIKGREIYQVQQGGWEPRRLMLLEWAGDFKCKTEGKEGWESKSGSLMIVKNDDVGTIASGRLVWQGENHSLLERIE